MFGLMQNIKWKQQQILWAKHLNNSEHQIFAKYKDTFGNSKWIKKYLILIAAILTIINEDLSLSL